MYPSDYSAISFPTLGIEVNPGRTLSIGPLTIHYYGLVIALDPPKIVYFRCCGYHYYEGNFNYFE